MPSTRKYRGKKKAAKGLSQDDSQHISISRKVNHFNEFFPLDTLRVMLQYLTIHDLHNFNIALVKNSFFSTFQSAMFGLIVYDNDLVANQRHLKWISTSGLLFPSLRMESSNKSIEILHNSAHILQSVDFSSVSMTPQILNQLSQCPKLTEINLTKCYDLTSTEFVTFITSSPNLTSISLRSCNFDASRIFASPSSLLHLDLSTNHRITNEVIAAITRQTKKLRTLDISSTGVSDVGIRAILANCSELESLIPCDFWNISDPVRMLIYTTLSVPQLMSSDLKMNLLGVNYIAKLISRVNSPDRDAILASGISRVMEFLSSKHLELQLAAAKFFQLQSQYSTVSVPLPLLVTVLSSKPHPLIIPDLLSILENALEECDIETRDMAIAAGIIPLLLQFNAKKYSSEITSTVFSLTTPQPPLENEVLFQLLPIFREILFMSEFDAEAISILAPLIKDQTSERLLEVTRHHLLSPILYLLRNRLKKDLIPQHGMEILLTFCRSNESYCGYLVGLGIIPIFHTLLRRLATNKVVCGLVCECLEIISTTLSSASTSASASLLSFDLFLECDLISQVISQSTKKTPNSRECLLALSTFANDKYHLTQLYENKIVIILKSILHSTNTSLTTDSAIHNILSLLERLVFYNLLSTTELNSMIGFEIRQLITSPNETIVSRAMALLA